MGNIEQCVKEIGNNDGWFNLMKMMKANGGELPKISMCIGARRTGKTVYGTHLAVLLWQRYRRTTLWLRNQKVEYESPTFMEGFLNAAREYGWITEDESWTADKDGIHQNGNHVIRFGSLSTFSNLRGNADFTTDLIFIDEFIPESGKYPKKCATGLLSVSRTIFSGREEARIIMCANDIQLANPYFTNWRVYPDPDKDVTVFDSGIGIERLYGYRRAKPQGQWAELYKRAGYTDYMDSRAEDSQIRLIADVPKTARPMDICLMPVSGNVYRPWQKNGKVYFAPFSGDRSGLMCYTTDPRLVTDDVYLMHNRGIMNWIYECLSMGKGRFADANTMYDLMTLLFVGY